MRALGCSFGRVFLFPHLAKRTRRPVDSKQNRPNWRPWMETLDDLQLMSWSETKNGGCFHILSRLSQYQANHNVICQRGFKRLKPKTDRRHRGLLVHPRPEHHFSGLNTKASARRSSASTIAPESRKRRRSRASRRGLPCVGRVFDAFRKVEEAWSLSRAPVHVQCCFHCLGVADGFSSSSLGPAAMEGPTR